VAFARSSDRQRDPGGMPCAVPYRTAATRPGALPRISWPQARRPQGGSLLWPAPLAGAHMHTTPGQAVLYIQC
jgi:hypothetical protein